VAWLIVYGAWPSKNIDHINGVKTDNRIANLRDVSQSINGENRAAPRKSTRSGFLGVTKDKDGKFRAQISVGGKNTHLGVFAVAEEAFAAYLSAKRRLHVGCTI
jgi:HNH endonuclease/AP2 domain